MKRISTIFLVFLMVIMSLALLSSCKDKKLEARVNALEEEIKSIEKFRLSPSYYGAVYKLTENSWKVVEDFYNSHEECKNHNYSSPYYDYWDTYEDGKEVFLNSEVSIGIKNDNMLSICNYRGEVTEYNYSLMGNTIIIEEEGEKIAIGSFSDDKSSIQMNRQMGVQYTLFLI